MSAVLEITEDLLLRATMLALVRKGLISTEDLRSQVKAITGGLASRQELPPEVLSAVEAALSSIDTITAPRLVK